MNSIALFILMLMPFCIEAGTVRMMNDTPFTLTATIYAADGTQLGQTRVAPEETTSWSDEEYADSGTEGNFEHFGVPSLSEQDSIYSQTPYTVIWTCPEGVQYSLCQQVATGGMVTAQTCGGSHYCKPKKKDSIESDASD